MLWKRFTIPYCAGHYSAYSTTALRSGLCNNKVQPTHCTWTVTRRSRSQTNFMGGQSEKKQKLRVDARKFAGQYAAGAQCSMQVAQVLMCLQRESFDEAPGQCKAQYSALEECAKSARVAAAARKGHVPTINYHLARMAKLMRR